MSFLAPAAALFAIALPIVVVFYLLKRRRTTRLVSSTLLWQKFLAETQASAPFQKLRHNWLLLLQLLLLALVILALMRPFFGGQPPVGRLRVLVLDGSASMQATDVKPARFSAARAEALKWADGVAAKSDDVAASDQFVVVLAGGQTEVKLSATSDKRALRRALEASVPGDGPTRLAEALKLAETLVKNQPGAEIHLYSDGAASELGEFGARGLPLTYHRVGVRSQNLAIIAADVRANPAHPAQRALFCTVANFSTNELSTEIELRFGNQLLDARPLRLAPRQNAPQVFAVTQPEDGVFHLKLTATDDLAVDNDVRIVSLLPQPVNVTLVTRGNRFLEKALRGAGNTRLTAAPSLEAVVAAADVVVLDDVQPTTWPSGNVLAFHVANTNWFTDWRNVDAPPIIDWRQAHPVLRSVTLNDVAIAESLVVKVPDWAVSLVDSTTTPLAVAGELGRQRVVWVGFDPLRSTWPLRVSFPIFIANALQWLDPAAARNSRLNLHAGEPYRVALDSVAGAAELITPDGQKRALQSVGSAGELIVGDTSRIGIYQIRAGTNAVQFAVNLLDGRESDLVPREELTLGKYATVSAAPPVKANREIWRWLLIGGLGVLLFEWWFYHRRTA
jgi:hypothetical protein